MNEHTLTDCLKIDGSYKEGGGQILRNAITYAVLLRKPVTITNIRVNRPKNQGVRPQHLTGMKLAVEICGGVLIGAEVGSTEVSYVPPKNANTNKSTKRARIGNDHGVKYLADTGTAGSVALLLQTSFLPALMASMKIGQTVDLELRGGTNAEAAPQIDYVTKILLPFINGYYQQSNGENKRTLNVEIVKRGYYPKGGGIIHAFVSPPISVTKSLCTFPPINLTKTKPVASLKITAFHAGNCQSWIPQKMVDGAIKALKRACKENLDFCKRFSSKDGDSKTDAINVVENAEIEISHDTNCLGSGSGIMIVAYPLSTSSSDSVNHELHHLPLGASALGNRKTPPLQSGMNAANELIDCIASGGCVDRWMQDQLIPFMALAACDSDGVVQSSEIFVGELTLHTQTAIAVAEWITGCKFEIEKLQDTRPLDHTEQGNKTSPNDYGEAGLIHGKHLIRCKGIGFKFT